MAEQAQLDGTRSIPPDGAEEPEGVCFPLLDGRPSSSAACRELLADAAAAADRDLERRIRSSGNWRREYASLLRELTLRAARTERSLEVAARGLGSLHSRICFARGDERIALGQAFTDTPTPSRFSTGTLTGTAERRAELRIPYAGRELGGEDLLSQLERWVHAGTIEPSVAERVAAVVEHPEWLALDGRTVVLTGAGSEIGPLAPLCAWGVDVVALDLPAESVWERIRATAVAGAGTVRLPLGPDGSPGLDVLKAPAEAATWLSALPGDRPLTLGMHAYADGGRHVLLSAAFEAIAAHLLDHGRADSLAFLATPTDAYVIPEEAVQVAQARFRARGARRLMQAPARIASAGRLFAPAYGDGVPVADALIAQQGPNYAIAKRVQRWHGAVARAAGHHVSFNVAPATWTRSVTSNRLLRAAYGGAHLFGIEIFDPETTRALMAAMLVYDLQQPPSADEDPDALLMEGAAHGGLWRAAYEPRSVLGLAALAGLPGALRG